MLYANIAMTLIHGTYLHLYIPFTTLRLPIRKYFMNIKYKNKSELIYTLDCNNNRAIKKGVPHKGRSDFSIKSSTTTPYPQGKCSIFFFDTYSWRNPVIIAHQKHHVNVLN